MSVQYEIFEAAKHNNLKRVEELLDAGVNVNLTDFDNKSTPLHYAASNGGRPTLEMLVRRGANINAQNKHGRTALHYLVSSRYDVVALWLIRAGADINIHDRKGLSPLDLAHGFMQEDMVKAAKERFDQIPPEKEKVVSPPSEPPLGSDNLKIRLPNGAYKTILISNKERAIDVIKLMAEKMNIIPLVPYLELVEFAKNEQKKVDSEEPLWPLKSKWPLVLSGDGNDTQSHYYFMLSLKKTAPVDAIEKFQTAIST
jgi:ankyrin repeat protein